MVAAMRASRALIFSCLSATTLFACKDDADTSAKADAAAAQPAGDSEKGADPAAPKAAGAAAPSGQGAQGGSAGPLTLPSRVKPSAPVLGQFVISNSDALLKRMQGVDALAPYKQYLDARGLQALVAMGAEEYGDSIRGVSVTEPAGCAMLASEPYDDNFGCAFTFDGGATGFVTKLGANVKAGTDGHAGSFDADGKTIYIDALEGDHVAVTAGTKTFASLGDHLEKQVLGRGKQLGEQIEFVMLGKQAAELLGKANELNGPLPTPTDTGEPFVDGLQRIVFRVQDWQRKNPAAGMDGLQQYTFSMTVNDGLPSFDFAMHIDPKSTMGKAYQAASYMALEADELKVVPPGALAFMLAGMDSSKWGSDAFDNGQSDAMLRIWGEETGLGAEQVKTALKDFFKAWAGKYGNLVGFTFDAREDGKVGLTLVRKLAGDSLRDDYAAWAGGLKPRDLFGKKMGASLEFEFKRAATTVAGKEVDRFIIKPAGPLSAEIAKDGDPMAKSVADGLVIDRVEVGGYVLTTFDLDPRAASLTTWVEWLAKPAGERNVTHMGSFAQPQPGLGFLGGVDTSAVAKLAGEDFKVAQGGLDDLRILGATIAPSNFMGRFEASKALLDTAGELAKAAGGPGGAPGGQGF
jgi:hypothetical protein